MSKNLSDNTPLRSSDKKEIKNFPIDYRNMRKMFKKKQQWSDVVSPG